jgi:flagellar basal body-associated protein FliL
MPDKSQSPARQRSRKLKIIGVIILLTGIVGAGIVYWLGTRSADLSDDLSMAAYNRPQTQQMERMYGKWGDFTGDVIGSLRQPGTQAFVIVAVAGVVAWICFYFARIDGDQIN